MRTPILIAVALGFVLTTSVCQARLWETMEQCVQRYGSPSDPLKENTAPDAVEGTSLAAFKSNGYAVSVIIYKGVVQLEVIWKLDNTTLSDVEKSTLMDSEAGKSEWIKGDTTGIDFVYDRADGQAVASSVLNKLKVMFCTKEYIAARRAKSAGVEKDKSKGF